MSLLKFTKKNKNPLDKNKTMKNYLDELTKQKDKKISCIIPAYNEEKNITKVLEVVKDFPFFDEVIVVDDGSADQTSEKAREGYEFKVIKHPKNRGKSAAVQTGMDNSKGELIVLLDADLLGLSQENIAKLIYLVMTKKYDLTILDRQGDREAIWGPTNCARLYGGEKCFWRKDFEKIKIPKNGGYLVDVLMNLYYIKNNKRVRTLYCKNLYTVHQFNKVGKIRGYYNYMKISYKYIKASGLKGMLEQIKQIEDEYSEIKQKHKTKNFRFFNFGS